MTEPTPKTLFGLITENKQLRSQKQGLLKENEAMRKRIEQMGARLNNLGYCMVCLYATMSDGKCQRGGCDD